MLKKIPDIITSGKIFELGISISFSITALLRQNSHNHKIYPFKCMTQWFLLRSQSCTIFTTINFITFLSLPKEVSGISLAVQWKQDSMFPLQGDTDSIPGQGNKIQPFPSSRDLPDPGSESSSPTLADGFFTTEPPGKPANAT